MSWPKILALVLIFFILVGCTNSPIPNNLSFSEMGYGKPKIFVYDVTISDSNNIPIAHDTLALISTDIISDILDSQTKSQWLLLNRDSINGKFSIGDYYDITGVISDDSTLLIHPPRMGKYRILEFCPMPYFQLTSHHNTWDWDLFIGSGYALPEYPVLDLDTFSINYSLSDTLYLNTLMGRVLCYQIKAVSRSKFGISTSTFNLNNQFGLVSFTSSSVSKVTYKFNLFHSASYIDSSIYDDRMAKYFEYFTKHNYPKTDHSIY
jgi:hypothetical protein